MMYENVTTLPPGQVGVHFNIIKALGKGSYGKWCGGALQVVPRPQ